MLIDRWHRQLNYLRISITDRCNLRCIYCQTGPVLHKLKHDEILRYEEILRIINAGIALGIKKVRITGGEPLVRKGVFSFLKTVSNLPGLEDISITTNGILLDRHINDLIAANIQRINVSLDTLNADKYALISGANKWHQVWNGILNAHNTGIYPIKLNIVAMKGINDDECLAFANLTYQFPFWIRFIELMPVGHSDIFEKRWVSSDTIKQAIESHFGPLKPVKKNKHDGPADRFKLADSKGEIGFIHAISHHFCETCNRLRLTANGNLRACLLSDSHIDLRTLLRSGCSDEDLKQQFMAAVLLKPVSHSNNISHPHCLDQMVRIGG
jgi:cyclic pyranopterin phosphate synthase